MEEQWVVDRSRLRTLLLEHPERSAAQLGAELGRSKGWVKKWRKRLRVDMTDDRLLYSRSRARKHPPEPISQAVVDRILELREHPPSAVPRVIGGRTILYYLNQDAVLKASGQRLPRSTSTIWYILDRHECIKRQAKVKRQPFETPPPMMIWEIDFRDVSGVKVEATEKRQHQVEVFNVVDRGSSMALDALPSADDDAEEALKAITHTLTKHGLPRQIVMDRDPRFVASWSTDGYPSALVRFLLCLGVSVDICDPHRPQQKPFVERFNRTQGEEALDVYLPKTMGGLSQVLNTHEHTFNYERPNQARSCHDQPPAIAAAPLPRLPELPLRVDPDSWLKYYHLKRFRRRVDSNGSVSVGKDRYYIGRQLKGRYVVLILDAQARQFQVELDNKPYKSLPMKCLYNETLSFDEYFEMMCHEAQSIWRRHLQRIQRRVALSRAA